MSRKSTKPAVPAAPVAQYADKERVRYVGTDYVGSVVSTAFTPDDLGRETQWEMVTVRWDDRPDATAEVNPGNLERESLTDAERDYADACAFARTHD